MIPIESNQINTFSNAVSMSSREIADLTGKHHAHVIRDIRVMLDALKDDPILDHVREDLDARGYTENFHLGRNLTETLITGYSIPLRHKVIQRLHQLESELKRPDQTLPDFSNPAEAARAWAEQYELREAANQQLAIAAPKAEFVDRYVDGTGLKGFRQVAKLLGAKENDFRLFLQDRRVMYRLGGEWVPFAEHVDAGRFSVKTGQADNGHAFNSAKFTPKGVQWIAGLWIAHKSESQE